MYQLFSGPYYDYVLSQEPLCGAEYFARGSSAMLFQRDGNLYRLTTDGCGHGFLAEQSAKGNPSVVHVFKDFGPLAPSDDYGDWGVYYWLAQVERMEPIDPNSLEGARLNAILLSLTKGESSVDPADRPQFLIDCEAAAAAHEEFAPLLRTLIQAENSLFDEEGLVDANITNVMRRPATGELAWVDPINEAIGTLTEAQEAEMERVHELIRAKAATA